MKQLLSFRLQFFSGSDFKIQRIWLHNFWLCLKKTGWHDIIQIILSQCMIQQVWKYLPEVRNPILVRNFKRPRNSKTRKLIGCMWKILFVRRKSAIGRVKENLKKGTTVNLSILWCCISYLFANICILIRTIPVCPHHSKGLGVDSNTMVNISSVTYGISSPNCHIHCRFIG